ncbi:MAG TPA: protoporphyrinogen oxidase [Terriglobales bacterium]|nr:protoporphyrinogen oxidase [Terriglobales bacterium]
MRRVAIVGGGSAGLSAAFYLERARRNGAQIEWTLFEKSDRLGGVIKTEIHDGFVLEAGPDSFLTAKAEGAQFCRDLGIADQLIYSNDASRKTYVLVQGKLVEIPPGLEFMVPTRIWSIATSPLFSFRTKLRMAGEWFTAARSSDQDESVGEFVRRHFGREMMERVAEPLLAGVYGGNADEMSVRAVLPLFAEMERTNGSLVRATLRSRKRREQDSASQPLFTSLKGGMQQMVDAAAASLPAERIRLRQPVIAVQPCNDDWQITAGGQTEKFQAVLLALPAASAAVLLRQFHPALMGGLRQIRYSSSAAVALGYQSASLPAGHGFLVPRTEGKKMMACTFVHRKFPYRVPDGAALLRCFFSSSRARDLLSHTDDELLQIACSELKDILGLAGEPCIQRMFRWEAALPQYSVGHLERVAEMERVLAEIPGVQVIGNSFHGVGIPDCIRSGREAAEKIISS